MSVKAEYGMLVRYIDKNGNVNIAWLTRREITNLSIEERSQILTDQVEKFMRENPDYYKEYNV
jgi:hypothetical protein